MKRRREGQKGRKEMEVKRRIKVEEGNRCEEEEGKRERKWR